MSQVLPMHKRLNLRPVILFCVSAALHAAVLVAFPTKNIIQPLPQKSAAIQLLVQAASNPQPAALPSQQLLAEHDAPLLPDVTLPASAIAVPDHAKPQPVSALRQSQASRESVSDMVATSAVPVLHPKHRVKKQENSAEPKALQENNSRLQESPSEVGHNAEEGGGQLPGADNRAGMDTYMREILLKIERNKQYPLKARTRRIEGKVIVGFNLLADGTIHPPEVVSPSGYDVLDRCALQAVIRAAPFLPPPKGLIAGEVLLEVVLVFQLQ